MFTHDDKHGEANLARGGLDARSAVELSRPQSASRARRRARATRSARVERLIGLPGSPRLRRSRGQGASGELIVTRIAAGGATCAIAYAARRRE